MQQFQGTLDVKSKGPGLYAFDDAVKTWLSGKTQGDGLLTLYIPHTSASLLIQENYDPDVAKDMQDFFSRIVKHDPALYRHTLEGPDDMPAHIRSALTQTHLSIPVLKGKLGLGTWQGIFLFEHRDQPHTRKIHLTYQGH